MPSLKKTAKSSQIEKFTSTMQLCNCLLLMKTCELTESCRACREVSLDLRKCIISSMTLKKAEKWTSGRCRKLLPDAMCLPGRILIVEPGEKRHRSSQQCSPSAVWDYSCDSVSYCWSVFFWFGFDRFMDCIVFLHLFSPQCVASWNSAQ